ncbi:hypothetical protein IFM89_024273 [Coptis chinensis]|uniref:Glycosyltransferase family 92 protein n=1 Tax=Coptis chinensis TaxID=261450 RepID=A0A835HP30_9MAGN|nr:hypothetical protein IFM89_024273 [Coptis chinensis]
MRRKNHTPLISIFISFLLFTTLSLYVVRNFFSGQKLQLSPSTIKSLQHNNLIKEEVEEDSHRLVRNNPPLVKYVQPESVLLPDWEVLFVSSPDSILSKDNEYTCVFQNNETSPGEYTGFLQSSNRTVFKCEVPDSVRCIRPLLKPILTKSDENITFSNGSNAVEMIRWSFLAYESLSTENDVILFAKGINNRQGVNRSPEELLCVFDNGVGYSVKTSVVTSAQEVFRCNHPTETELGSLFKDGDEKIKISLEIVGIRPVRVPSVAYYVPKSSIEDGEGKAQLCACTMVCNVAKFLKEWVIYNSKLGVEKFILYDNDSDDDLHKVVQGLVDGEEYNVKVFFWPWPKAQEAGFSHSAIYAKESCKWMMYMDVDEFIFAHSWLNASEPSQGMIPSFLPTTTPLSSPPAPSSNTNLSDEKAKWLAQPIGQVSIKCLEYGPSNQQSHPIAGVTQGYTCRRRNEQRHKSIVLLDTIDTSLHNAIHHFRLKEGWRGNTLSLHKGVVHHFKYQAWSEFKAKFRRRVSTYVVDWTQEVNLKSKDRTPGLGLEAIEPEGWAQQFCEVNDTRLKSTTQRWFSQDSAFGSKLVWQD